METPSFTSPPANAGSDRTGELIYHITSRQAWTSAVESGLYRGDTLDSEGFIHCSKLGQVSASGERFFSGKAGLVVLEIDPSLLASRLVFEQSGGGEEFPHIYGPLAVLAVRRVLPASFDPAGRFTFPV